MHRAGLDPAQIKNLTRPVTVRTAKLFKGEEKARGFDQEFISAMIFLIILYTTILIYGSSIMRGVIEEKSSRIIEILLSSTTPFQLMMGKLFGLSMVSLAQYLVWTILGGSIFLITVSTLPAVTEFVTIPPSVLFYFVLYFIIGFFTFSTLYAATGAICSDMHDAQVLSTPVTLLIVLPFMIGMMVIRDPGSDIAQILSFLPFFAPLIMFLRILLISPSFGEVLLSLLINIVTIIFLIHFAARIFRIGILMYGKRPTIPEILRWARTP